MPETWPGHLPRPVAIIGWDGTRYSAFRLRPGGTLQVRGEDQLESYQGLVCNQRNAIISGANGYCDSNPVPAGDIWKITAVSTRNATTAVTIIEMNQRHGLLECPFSDDRQAFAISQHSTWSGELYLVEDDVIRVYFAGGLVGDTCLVNLMGKVMTLET